MKCARCGETLDRAMLAALVMMCGGHASWDPIHCPDGQEHEFAQVETAKEAVDTVPV